MLLRAETPLEEQVRETRGFDDFELKLGDVMRGERATLGKSLLDVQRELRIRASFIAAIENCDLSAFDVPSFIAGYVRSYARYLGMDPEECFGRFCAESGFRAVQPAEKRPGSGTGQRHRAADAAEGLANPHPLFMPQPQSLWLAIEPRALGSMLVLVALVVGLGYGGWSVLREIQRVDLSPVDAAPGVISVLDPTQDVSRGAPDADATEVAMQMPAPEGFDRIYRPQALELPVLTRRDGPIASIDPGLGATSPAVIVADATAVSGPSPDSARDRGAVTGAMEQALVFGPQQSSSPVGTVRTVTPDAPTVELLAVRPAWVRVTAPDGSVILEKTMDAGERFALPKLETPPILRTGNSGGVYFAVNDQTYGPVAPGAQVVKNIELSSEAVTANYPLAVIDEDPALAKMLAMVSVVSAPGLGDAATD